MQTRGIIVKEYGLIAKELYQLGHKTEAKIMRKLAVEVSNAGFTTRAQTIFDKSTHDLNQKRSQNSNVPDIER